MTVRTWMAQRMLRYCLARFTHFAVWALIWGFGVAFLTEAVIWAVK